MTTANEKVEVTEKDTTQPQEQRDEERVEYKEDETSEQQKEEEGPCEQNDGAEQQQKETADVDADEGKATNEENESASKESPALHSSGKPHRLPKIQYDVGVTATRIASTYHRNISKSIAFRNKVNDFAFKLLLKSKQMAYETHELHEATLLMRERLRSDRQKEHKKVAREMQRNARAATQRLAPLLKDGTWRTQSFKMRKSKHEAKEQEDEEKPEDGKETAEEAQTTDADKGEDSSPASPSTPEKKTRAKSTPPTTTSTKTTATVPAASASTPQPKTRKEIQQREREESGLSPEQFLPQVVSPELSDANAEARALRILHAASRDASLTTLNLSNCVLSPSAMVLLSTTVASHPSLTRLSLENATLITEVLGDFTRAVSECPNLHFVTTRGSNIPEQWKKEVRRALQVAKQRCRLRKESEVRAEQRYQETVLLYNLKVLQTQEAEARCEVFALHYSGVRALENDMRTDFASITRRLRRRNQRLNRQRQFDLVQEMQEENRDRIERSERTQFVRKFLDAEEELYRDAIVQENNAFFKHVKEEEVTGYTKVRGIGRVK